MVSKMHAEDLFRSVRGAFITDFPPQAKLTPVFNSDSALKHLKGSAPPSTILIAGVMIARHRDVWERIIDHMRNGSRVVLAGSSSIMVTTAEFQQMLAILDLAWERGCYCRAQAELQSGILDQHLTENLPFELGDKTAFLQNVREP